jgi:F420H(2)-dependent quinone reductase
MMRLVMALHALVYRLTKGRFGGKIGANPILLLSVVGRRTGKRYVAPLGYMPYGDAYVVPASAMGAPKHPEWCLNLRANPRTTIEVGGSTIAVHASEAAGQERQELWDRFLRTAPYLVRHEQKAKREIPLVILRPV